MDHDWTYEMVYAGQDYWQQYWFCPACLASGGRVVQTEDGPAMEEGRVLILAGTPLYGLSEDCDEARKQVDDYLAKYPEWANYLNGKL